MSGDLCANCSSSLHERCCARCGSQKFARGRNVDGQIYCTAACEKAQARADRISDAMERDAQNPSARRDLLRAHVEALHAARQRDLTAYLRNLQHEITAALSAVIAGEPVNRSLMQHAASIADLIGGWNTVRDLGPFLEEDKKQ